MAHFGAEWEEWQQHGQFGMIYLQMILWVLGLFVQEKGNEG